MSSYKNNINFLDLIGGITFLKSPKKIVEFGILNGHSLNAFVNNSNCDTVIKAYDIFDDFNGNHADKETIQKLFEKHENVVIEKADFYEKYQNLYNDIDILHVDIANNGDTYKFVIDNYLGKIKEDGIILLEGGSKERDEVYWMNKYNKPKINPYLKELKKNKNICVKTIGTIPSITIIKKSIKNN